jgi:hypothetical protein
MTKDSSPELSLPGFKGRIDPAWDTPSVRAALADCPGLVREPETRILLRSRNTVAVVRIPLASGQKAPAVLKDFSTRGVNRLKSLVLPSKAAKAWRGARALLERNINTARPIAYLESRKRGFVDRSYFLAEYLDGLREIRFLLRELRGGALDGLLRAAAVFLAEAHDRGVVHKDLSDGNILVKTEGAAAPVFYLLDTNRVRVKNSVGPCLRMKNLVRLGIPAGRRDYFLDQYGRGKSIPRRLRWWYKFQKSVYTGRVNLKKKLRLKQLAAKLGIH